MKPTQEDGQPRTITVTGRSRLIDVSLRFDVASVVTTQLEGALSTGLNFLQMRGQYTVTGKAGDRDINFTAPGSAETFRRKYEPYRSRPIA
jgi:hypothetical protein